MGENYRKIPRIMIAAPKSGSGKTTITCGMLQYLKNNNFKVASFKCGPDYIDPMYHRKVLGLDVGNLDTYFVPDKEIQKILASTSGECVIVEGVMGLYDGLGGIYEKSSSYEVAIATKTPIILVVDAHGSGRTLISQIKGILEDDHENLIKGIILNKTSREFCERLKPLLFKMFDEKRFDCKVIGCVPNNSSFEVGSRHLGLQLPDEIEKINEKLNEIASVLAESLDFEVVNEIMNQAEPIELEKQNSETNVEGKVKIAVAMDEAFCFYYKENLEIIKSLGAEIIPFSPIHDKKVPDDVDGIILGGGYPELYLNELSKNRSMMESVRACISSGIPSLAECGGFMYLHKTVENKEGNSFELVGAIDAKCSYTGKLVRFGYAEIAACNDDDVEYSLEGLKGHEFHYYDSSDNGDKVTMSKPLSDKKWNALHINNGSVWGFPHFYYPSKPEFIMEFIDRCSKD